MRGGGVGQEGLKRAPPDSDPPCQAEAPDSIATQKLQQNPYCRATFLNQGKEQKSLHLRSLQHLVSSTQGNMTATSPLALQVA